MKSNKTEAFNVSDLASYKTSSMFKEKMSSLSDLINAEERSDVNAASSSDTQAVFGRGDIFLASVDGPALNNLEPALPDRQRLSENNEYPKNIRPHSPNSSLRYSSGEGDVAGDESDRTRHISNNLLRSETESNTHADHVLGASNSGLHRPGDDNSNTGFQSLRVSDKRENEERNYGNNSKRVAVDVSATPLQAKQQIESIKHKLDVVFIMNHVKRMFGSEGDVYSQQLLEDFRHLFAMDISSEDLNRILVLLRKQASQSCSATNFIGAVIADIVSDSFIKDILGKDLVDVFTRDIKTVLTNNSSDVMVVSDILHANKEELANIARQMPSRWWELAQFAGGLGFGIACKLLERLLANKSTEKKLKVNHENQPMPILPELDSWDINESDTFGSRIKLSTDNEKPVVESNPQRLEFVETPPSQ